MLQGKIAVVTGGTRGIGKAICTAFKDQGATVHAFGQRTGDLGTKDGLEATLRALRGLPWIDILVNNAGINQIGSFKDTSWYEKIHHVNTFAPLELIRAASGLMPDDGKIINISSIFGTRAPAGRVAYAASKASLEAITRVAAIELAPILVNSVSPGFTQTELTQNILGHEKMTELTSQIPLGRLARPYEIAQTVLFLVSSMNTYITGQNIVVDGGFLSNVTV